MRLLKYGSGGGFQLRTFLVITNDRQLDIEVFSRS